MADKPQVPMVRGNALKKVNAGEVASHGKRGWRRFADLSEPERGPWWLHAEAGRLDPSVVALMKAAKK